MTADHRALEPRATPDAPVFQRPAELVDISERIYQQVFAVGTWVAAGLSGFAALASLLQPTTSSQLRGVMVCGLYTVFCLAAANRPAPLYATLRRRPRLLLLAGAALSVGAYVVGPDNFQLFLPIIAILGVAGIATPRHMVAGACLLTIPGLAMPQVLDGRGDLGTAIIVMVPPLMFWLIVDRITGFALQLHQKLNARDGSSQDPLRVHHEPGTPPATTPSERVPPGLPAPRSISVDGTRLTARQLQVILLICEGLDHTEMGACLQIGPQQVRRHLGGARARTGCATTPQMVAWAQRTGLLPG